MRCCYPEIDRLMRHPSTRPVTEYELDAIVAASGRTRGVFVDDPTSGVNRKRRSRPATLDQYPIRDHDSFDDRLDW